MEKIRENINIRKQTIIALVWNTLWPQNQLSYWFGKHIATEPIILLLSSSVKTSSLFIELGEYILSIDLTLIL